MAFPGSGALPPIAMSASGGLPALPGVNGRGSGFGSGGLPQVRSKSRDSISGGLPPLPTTPSAMRAFLVTIVNTMGQCTENISIVYIMMGLGDSRDVYAVLLFTAFVYPLTFGLWTLAYAWRRARAMGVALSFSSVPLWKSKEANLGWCCGLGLLNSLNGARRLPRRAGMRVLLAAIGTAVAPAAAGLLVCDDAPAAQACLLCLRRPRRARRPSSRRSWATCPSRSGSGRSSARWTRRGPRRSAPGERAPAAAFSVPASVWWLPGQTWKRYSDRNALTAIFLIIVATGISLVPMFQGGGAAGSGSGGFEAGSLYWPVMFIIGCAPRRVPPPPPLPLDRKSVV